MNSISVRGNHGNKMVKKKQIQLPEWEKDNVSALPPEDLTVTSLKQSNQLRKVKDACVIRENNQTSAEWLHNHAIDVDFLAFKHSSTLTTTELTVGTEKNTVKDIEELSSSKQKYESDRGKLEQYLYALEERKNWLLSGSRKIFGVIKGDRPCLIIDASDANLALDRLYELKSALKILLCDQLLSKQKLQLCCYGTEVSFAWRYPRTVNTMLKKDAEEWIENLTPSGGCNLLSAIKSVLKLNGIDSIAIVTGCSTDHLSSALTDYMVETLSGRQIFIQTISLNSIFPESKLMLEEIANKCQGRNHNYSVEAGCFGSDLVLLSNEIERCRNALIELDCVWQEKSANDSKKNGTVTALMEAGIFNQITEKFEGYQTDGEYRSLAIEQSFVSGRTSKDWLKSFGLKAQALTLYQLMAPNAYSYVRSYVPTIDKQIESRIHHQSMVQMEWHDGSIKNVHVDPIVLCNYQKHLKNALNLYKKRLSWLCSDSRKLCGNIVEQNVSILVDMCGESIEAAREVQTCIKELLEQQLSNKMSFNIVCFGKSVNAFRSAMVPPSDANLTACWNWFLQQEYSGMRNLLPALRCVLAIPEDQKPQKALLDVQGIYLMSTGPPNEIQEVLSSYVSEILTGRNIALNCILIQSLSQHALQAPRQYTASLLRNLSHQNKGRFHWICSNDIVESDDIQQLSDEMSKAFNYYQKSELLLEKMKDKSTRETDRGRLRSMSLLTSSSSLSKKEEFTKPAIKNSPSMELSVKTKLKRRSVTPKFQVSTCRSNERSTIKPLVKSTYKWLASKIEIPEKEEEVSTKDWLHSYGLTNLNLHLHNLASVSECNEFAATRKKDTNRRYCKIFPSFEKNGRLFHLHLTTNELEKYEKRLTDVLLRYTNRLQWLLKGSRNMFGTILETNVVIVIDTSGSVVQYLKELKTKLVSLIWEQLHRKNKRFNLLKYSYNVWTWKDTLVEATTENCHEAVQWLDSLECHGETATLSALKRAFNFQDVQGVYLVTDGKPDNSTSMVLREVANMNIRNVVKIHTISFNCCDRTANKFLQMLALQSKGRYHRFVSNQPHLNHSSSTNEENIENLGNKTLFEGDDLRMLMKEISLVRQYLQRSQYYRSLMQKSNGN